MDKTTLKEITALWDKIGDMERRQSCFTDAKAKEVKAINGKLWNPETLYRDGDSVLYNDLFARCLYTNRGIEPTNKIYWELLTVSDMILELVERVSALEEEGGDK